MVFESTNPFTSRDRFISRKFRIRVVIGVAFVAAVTVMSWLMSAFASGAFFRTMVLMLIGDAGALGAAYYFYIIWDRRPISLACTKCGKIISSTTPWVCGVCKKQNLNAVAFPFVNKCGHCGAEPKAYKCHHKNEKKVPCGEIIFLTDDEDETNYAYCLNSPGEMTRADKVRVNQETVEDKEHEIGITGREIVLSQLKVRLKEIEKKMAPKPEKSVLEAKKDGLKTFFDAKSAVKQAARDQRAFNAEKHKGDRRARMEDDAIVDMWEQDEMASGEGDDGKK